MTHLLNGRVISILVDNAAKYTPPGTPIDVRVQRLDDRIRVAIADHGPGIPIDQRLNGRINFSPPSTFTYDFVELGVARGADLHSKPIVGQDFKLFYVIVRLSSHG